MTTVTRCGDHLSKVWTATLEQGRSTSAGEVKWKMKSLRLSKHTNEQLEERGINHQDLLLEHAREDLWSTRNARHSNQERESTMLEEREQAT